MNLQKDLTPDVGFAYIVAGLLWRFMQGAQSCQREAY